MSSTYLDAQTPRAQTPRTQDLAPVAPEQWRDVELGTPPPPRATRVPERPAQTPAPTRPAPLAAPAPRSDKVIDPHSWWWAGGSALLGLIIGGIAAGTYARSKASARDNEGSDCWDDNDGNRHCPTQGDNTTHGAIIAVSLILPTVALAAITIGLRVSCGAWSISRADLQKRRDDAAERRNRPVATGGGVYNPGAGAAAFAQQQQNQQVWNQGVMNDFQAIGNGQMTAGFVQQPFNF